MDLSTLGSVKRPLVALAVLVLIGGLWSVLAPQGIERKAKKAARAPCVATGLSPLECDRRIDRGSARCFLLTYTPGSQRRGQMESFDEPAYQKCVSDTSADDWSRKRAKEFQDAKAADGPGP